jgi:(2Fe-2S) ferredoxin
MYKREPLGRHLVSVCTNFACKVRGAQDVYDHLAETLAVGHNETTDDGTFTLEHAECLGNCEGAPIVSIDYFNYEAMTPAGAERLLEQVASGDVPPPTRGVPSPGIRMVSHRLANLGPHPDDSDRGAEPGHATSVDGAVPPAAAAEVGPDAEVRVVTSEFSRKRDEQRADARQQVRSAGAQPDDVEQEGGPDAREFPSRSPDTGVHGTAETGEGDHA